LSRRAPILFLAALALTGAQRAGAAFRFPQPEFGGEYIQPVPSAPPVRHLALHYLDILILAGALGLASYLVLRRRRRPAIVGLMLFCLAYFGFYRGGCVCPIGAIQNIALALGDANYGLPAGVLLLAVLPMVATLLSGRTFCAAVCPLGAIQDAVVMRPVRVPVWLGHVLGFVPYVYLAGALWLAGAGVSFIICRLDPFVGLFRLTGSFPMIAAGIALLALGVFVARPYCRFLCPYGVLLGWLSWFSRRHATITPEACIRCRLCEDSCPFGAILHPTDEKAPETRRRGVRRLAMLLALLPLLVAGGAWLGDRLGLPLSKLHPLVAKAEEVRMEDAGVAADPTLASAAFRASGTPTRNLVTEALAVRQRTTITGRFVGAGLGLALAFRLISLSVRRMRRDYEPSRTACLSCGRCFAYCPVEPREQRPGDQKSGRGQ